MLVRFERMADHLQICISPLFYIIMLPELVFLYALSYFWFLTSVFLCYFVQHQPACRWQRCHDYTCCLCVVIWFGASMVAYCSLDAIRW